MRRMVASMASSRVQRRSMYSMISLYPSACRAVSEMPFGSFNTPRTSSTRPASIILCTRNAMRSRRASRCHLIPICTVSTGGYAPMPSPKELNVLPLPRHTSNARIMRRRLFGSIFFTASGSSSDNCSYRASVSRFASNCARILG